MATQTSPAVIPLKLQTVLDRLRRRIRVFVWVEGLALAMIWCGLLFWIFLAIDYLPILVGATEMPLLARAVYLAAVVGGLGYILYHWILRRAFVRLRNESMAVLLERQYADFHDGLLTSVELSEHPGHADLFDRAMLEHTNQDAVRHLGQVRVGRVFKFAPLTRKITAAAALAISILCFAWFASEASARAAKRMLLLSSEPWPRSAHIEVLDFPDDRIRKVARGSDFALRVRASTAYLVPTYCWVNYRTDDGDRGRLQTLREGQPRDGYQYFVCREGPFNGVIDSISFDVLGYDHRQSGYRLEMVDSPVVVRSSIYCEYPAYLVDEENSLFLPREKPVTTGIQLEGGTKLTLRIETNKDLEQAVVTIAGENTSDDDEEGTSTTIDLSSTDRTLKEGSNPRRYFEYDLGTLQREMEIEISLHDVDEVSSQQPYRLLIGMIEDQPPKIDARLKGIGSAITPDARIPAEGTIKDDYGVRAAWLELTVDGDEVRTYPFELNRDEIIGAEVDLRVERSSQEDRLKLIEGQSVSIVARASDDYDLTGPGQPNIGTGDRYELQVVSPDDLLRLLERRELELRDRFEQIISETELARDMLFRVAAEASSDSEPTITAEPGDSGAEPGDEAIDPETRRAERRGVSILRVQRSFQHSQKAGPELLGVALGFESILGEIENNRIDAVQRVERLQTRIADPLRHISEVMLPEWEAQLTELESALEDGDGAVSADKALLQSDAILAEMERILNEMLHMQDFNELVDMLRTIIDSQEEITEETRDLQRQRTLELIQ